MGTCWSKAKGKVKGKAQKKNTVGHGRDANGNVSCSKVASSSHGGSRSEGDILQSPNLRCFSFNDLRTCTRNFRPDSVLGEGGFGSVFKGWIDEHSFSATKPGTGIVIAVKRLNQEGLQGHKEWLAEVNYLGQFQHPNLVKLFGYCLENEHRLLVYEFMPRGSLESHLFRRGPHYKPLSWNLRMRIALGAAKGLAFLHSPQAKVIYRDFKTSNVLLDSVGIRLFFSFLHFFLPSFCFIYVQNYVAKLSDFGLAKDGPTGDKSHVSTTVMGTYGYAAPEYLATGHLTARSDVYSYGVVLLEMLTGRRTLDKNRPSTEQNLVDWAKPFLTNKRRIYRVLDPRLEGQYPRATAQKAATTALLCLSKDPKQRPTMDEVVVVLEQLQDSNGVVPQIHHQYNQPTRQNRIKDSEAIHGTIVASPRPPPA